MQQPANLDVIARTAKLSKTKTYRTLRALQDDGFVDHVSRDGYRIGSRSLALASLVGPRPALLAVALPVLRWLADVSSEWATLNLRSGSHRVQVLTASPPGNPIPGAAKIGERAPLTSGCSGRSILAHLPDDEAQAIIESRPPREIRPTAAELAEIRDNGYGISFSTNHAGVSGISAPILAPIDGYPLGSVSIGGLERRLPEARLRELGEPIRKASKRLAPKLARVLGPYSNDQLAALDVTLQDYVARE